MILERNERAARGAAFLESIEVQSAATLAEALRAFETGDADVGWLGAGLHHPRPGAAMFGAGRLGWVVLRTGDEASEWGAPGVAQKLADAVRPEQLQRYGLVPLPESGAAATWGGPPSELLVRRNAAHLAEIARVVVGVLSRPGHELRVVSLPAAQFARRRRSGQFALMIDFVRPVGSDAHALALSLMTAQDPALARRPPLGGATDPRHVTRMLKLGVLGQLDHVGASLGRFRGLSSWELGSVWDGALGEALL
jgi:peptide/nickel transport system substrate-binding protein